MVLEIAEINICAEMTDESQADGTIEENQSEEKRSDEKRLDVTIPVEMIGQDEALE